MSVPHDYQALHDWTLTAAVKALEMAALADEIHDPISAHNLRHAAGLLSNVVKSTKLRMALLAKAGEGEAS